MKPLLLVNREKHFKEKYCYTLPNMSAQEINTIYKVAREYVISGKCSASSNEHLILCNIMNKLGQITKELQQCG